MKEIEEDAKNGEIICIHGWEELISLKCSLFPKWCTDSVQFKTGAYYTEWSKPEGKT